jgi:hypothetical protein
MSRGMQPTREKESTPAGSPQRKRSINAPAAAALPPS